MSPDAARTAYWNRVAQEKTFSHPLDVDLLRGRLEPDSLVLDYGCGYGRLVAELQRAGFHCVVGVDPAPAMIARGRELFPGLDLRHAPEPCHAHLRDKFDAIVLFSVLTCVPDDEELDALAKGLTQLLVPGGLLCVSDLLLQEDARNRARYDAFAERGGPYGVFTLDEGVVLRHFTRAKIGELFDGFDEVSWRELDVVTMNGNPARAFQFAGCRPKEFTGA
ncbi:MAG: class I SAM-dependent methyltransferase [Planctomycetota bacterium]|jgi:SAM-dependent methyltransferase